MGEINGYRSQSKLYNLNFNLLNHTNYIVASFRSCKTVYFKTISFYSFLQWPSKMKFNFNPNLIIFKDLSFTFCEKKNNDESKQYIKRQKIYLSVEY